MIERRALSPVIATVILSAVVLAIGGGVWSYSLGAATVISEGYVNDTLELVDEVTERFMVEHVTNSSNGENVTLWVFNYGKQRIVVDVYLNATRPSTEETFTGSTFGTEILPGESKEIIIEFSPDTLVVLDGVSITVYSRRQNIGYKTYYVS